jgi:hypothetical protein
MSNVYLSLGTYNLLASGWLRSLRDSSSAPSILLGLLAGIFVSVGVESWHDRRNRPRLNIKEYLPEEGDPRFSCHAIRISNGGRSAAVDCAAFITITGLRTGDILTSRNTILTTREVGIRPEKFNLGKGEESVLLLDGTFREIHEENITWSRLENPLVVDIYPGCAASVDVCRWFAEKKVKVKGTPITKPAQVHIPSEDGWRRPRVALRAYREYLIRIDVSGRNARRVSRRLVLKTSAYGVEIEEAPIREKLRAQFRSGQPTRTT